MSKRKKSNRRTYLFALLIVTIGLVVYFLFQSDPKHEIPEQNEAMNIPFNKQGELFFTNGQKGDTLAVIDIEVADNNQLRARGLMYRSSIPENAGMLFIQSEEEMQSFWMKNTYIPLDILFVNAEKKIVTIQANATPLKEWSYASTEPALYVVEVNAGFTSRHGIQSGDEIEFIVTK